MRIISAYGDGLTAEAWLISMRSVVFKLLSSVEHELRGVQTASAREKQREDWKDTAIVVISVALLFYFSPKLIDFNPISRMYSSQTKEGILLIQNQSVSLKLVILLLSLFRYMVYLIQFKLLVKQIVGL